MYVALADVYLRSFCVIACLLFCPMAKEVKPTMRPEVRKPNFANRLSPSSRWNLTGTHISELMLFPLETWSTREWSDEPNSTKSGPDCRDGEDLQIKNVQKIIKKITTGPNTLIVWQNITYIFSYFLNLVLEPKVHYPGRPIPACLLGIVLNRSQTLTRQGGGRP